MNNSKFMELSNDEVMETEGGVFITGTAVLLAVYGGYGLYRIGNKLYKLGFSNGKNSVKYGR